MTAAILVAATAGTLSRWVLLHVDYRQYPSYPQGYLTHLFLGAIAAALGATALPAILKHSYEAVTFLSLAATQFRDVRAMERDSLLALEPVELVPRGPAYIEGIAKVFEARNYVAMLAALAASAVYLGLPLAPGWRAFAGYLAAGLVLLVLARLMAGRRVGDYADVRRAPLRFDGPFLYAGDAFLMNVGQKESRETILQYGLGAVIQPRDVNSRVTLASIGQRQTIVHDLSAVLGVRRDLDEAEFTPIARLDHQAGNIGVAIVPVLHDADAMVAAIARAPVVESAKRKPTAANAGRQALD